MDDEPDIRRVARMMLQKAGYDVLEAKDGQRAIEVINTGENRLMLDVVVCDMRMPMALKRLPISETSSRMSR